MKHDEQFGSFDEDGRLQNIYEYLEKTESALYETLDDIKNVKTPSELISLLNDDEKFVKGNINASLTKLFNETGIADIYVAGKNEAFIVNNETLDFVKNEEEKPKTNKKAKAEQKVDNTKTDTKADENVDTKDTLDTNLDTLDTVETAKQEEKTTEVKEQKTEKEKEEFSKPNTVDNYTNRNAARMRTSSWISARCSSLTGS